MTDLATFKTQNEEWLELEHPDSGEPLGVFIKLASADSDIYQKKRRQQNDKRIKKGLRKMKSEELENEGIEILIACTLEWMRKEDGEDKATIEFEGQELECNTENIRKLYKSPNVPWIKDQVSDFVEDRSNFLAK